RHACDQAIVQFLGGIITGQFKFGLERGHFDEPGQIAPGPHGDGDVGDVHPENLHEFLFDAEAVHVLHIIPGLQRDDEVHALLAADGFDAEHGHYVDDADAADFHVVAGQFGAGADDIPAVHERHLGDVVRDEAIAALDQ